jgi:hypothetical protein
MNVSPHLWQLRGSVQALMHHLSGKWLVSSPALVHLLPLLLHTATLGQDAFEDAEAAEKESPILTSIYDAASLCLVWFKVCIYLSQIRRNSPT